MSRKPVLVYGAGELGRQYLHHLVAHFADRVEPIGFVDDLQPAGAPVAAGLNALGSLAACSGSTAFGPGQAQLLFAIGYTDMTRRHAAMDRVQAAGWQLLTLVHPRASIEPGVELGAGCVVLAGAVLDQGVRLGACCHVDVGVRLTNSTVAGSNNWFSTGTSTGSRVHIGDDCFFGMDCTICNDIRLGSGLQVNAKSLVARDLGDRIKFVQRHQSVELPLP